MKLETFEVGKHLTYVKAWWHSRQSVDFHERMLPDCGFVAYEQDRPVAMAFLFTTNSKIAILGWPVSDPESDKQVRDKALNEVFKTLHFLARQKGFEIAWTTSGIPALQKRYENLGYVVGDGNINQYHKEL
jgi:hypothetical protein